MASKRRKTSPAQSVEHYLDEYEDHLTYNAYNALEEVAADIDDQTTDLLDTIEELETKIENLEKQLEDVQNDN